MNSGPSCEIEKVTTKSHNSLTKSRDHKLSSISTCGCVTTEFEDIATTASPFCSKDELLDVILFFSTTELTASRESM